MAIKLQRILCPTDFSESSEHALIYAFSFAQQYGATLYLLHVVEPLTPVPGVDMGPVLSYDDRPNVLDRIQELLEETIPEDIKGKFEVKPLICRGAPFLAGITLPIRIPTAVSRVQPLHPRVRAQKETSSRAKEAPVGGGGLPDGRIE